MMKKLISVIAFLLLGILTTFAASYAESSWKILEQAQVQFDNGNYGESLKLSNSALSTRKTEVESEYNILDLAISPVAVQRVGTEFVKVLDILREREQKDAVAVINKYLALYDVFYFDDDVHKMLEWLKNKTVYPEANYLIGQIYQVEGEYNTALSYMQKAYAQKEYLDISAVEFDILYSMAFLYQVLNDTESFEKTLLLVLKSDESFNNKLFMNSILNTIETDKKKNVDRLFLLYRVSPVFSLKALYELSNLYNSRGDSKNALVCSALGTIESFTYILEIINERDSRFKYTDFDTFLEECGKYEEIVTWGKENNVWENMFLFGDRAASYGKLVFAQTLYLKLANSIPDDYYKKLAASRVK